MSAHQPPAHPRPRPRPRLVRRQPSDTTAHQDASTLAAPTPVVQAPEARQAAVSAPAAAPAPAPRTAATASAPARTERPPRYDTQFIPFWFVGRVVQLAAWFGCLLSFLATTVGNIGMFGGDLRQAADGWSYVTSSAFLIPFVPSVPYQFVIQMCQFYAARKYGQSSWQYRGMLAASVGPSCWTYGQVIVPWVWRMSAVWWGSIWLARLPTVAILLLAAVVVIVLNDMVQEWLLVKREA